MTLRLPRLPLPRFRLVKRFGRDHGGTTALEFAMVAVPFLAILFGTLELGFIYLISATLDNATGDAARNIRTGQLQSGQVRDANNKPITSAAQFEASICAGMGWLNTTCQANLEVSVQPYASFAGTNGQQAPVSNGQMKPQSQLPYSCGGPGQIVLVQSYLSWPLIAPGFDKALQRLSSGAAVITSSTAFRNESYPAGATPTC